MVGSGGQGKRTQADYHERGHPRPYLVPVKHASQSNESGNGHRRKRNIVASASGVGFLLSC